MEISTLDLSALLEKGIITTLFFFLFIYAVTKWIPYIARGLKDTFEKQQAEHTHQIETITKQFEKTLETISCKFLDEIHLHHEQTKLYHERNGKKLDNIEKTMVQCQKMLRNKK